MFVFEHKKAAVRFIFILKFTHMKNQWIFAAFLASAAAFAPACKKNTTNEKASAAAPAIDVSKMQGQWQSNDDPKNVIVVAGDKLTSIYDGQIVSEKTIEVHNACPEPCAGGVKNMPCFMLKGQFDATCYSLVSLDANGLQYSMLGGRGNTLSYKKVQ